jgi:hypothetical protein
MSVPEGYEHLGGGKINVIFYTVSIDRFWSIVLRAKTGMR